MNPQLQQFARDALKKGLAECSPEQQDLFRRMYAPWAMKGNFTEANRFMPINEVVDEMPEDRLDWAMQQVQNTIAKNEERGLTFYRETV